MSKLYYGIKYILLIGLPCIFVGCLLVRQYFPEEHVFDWMFYIALSGFVGISTNTIAIRMLFRPKEPTFFGRQGLIPKNRLRIAGKIAEETEKRLLNIETIMDHIERGQVIEQTISLVTKAAEDYLRQQVNRKKIADTILDYYNEYADRIFVWLTRAAEGYVTEFVGRQVTVESVWAAVKPKLKEFFESDELKHKASTWIITNMISRVPEFSTAISTVLDRYIDDQIWWKKVTLQTVRQVSGLRKEAIDDIIRDILYSPHTYGQIVRLVEDNLQNIALYIERDEIRGKIETVHTWITHSLIQTTREKAIPALRDKIDGFLKSDQSWEVIDRQLSAMLHTVPSKLQVYLQRPVTVEKIRAFIPEILHKLNIKQIVSENIANQDTEEFENMIMKITGENLAAIEVLGGILGMLAGIALKKPSFLIILPAGIIAFLLIEVCLKSIKKRYFKI